MSVCFCSVFFSAVVVPEVSEADEPGDTPSPTPTTSPDQNEDMLSVQVSSDVELNTETIEFGGLDLLATGRGVSPVDSSMSDGQTTLLFPEDAQLYVSARDYPVPLYLRGKTTDGTPVFGGAAAPGSDIGPGLPDSTPNTEWFAIGSQDIGETWTGVNMDYSVDTYEDVQATLFYRAEDKKLTVAQRTLGSADWTLEVLDEVPPWDGHNDAKLAFDGEGYLHVTGNHHGDPLNYWKTTEPKDVTTLERLDEWTGENEGGVTYPSFFQGPGDTLMVKYRQGGAGDAVWYFKQYDPETGKWTRALDEPIVKGKRESGSNWGAYLQGPHRGIDGKYHVSWIWRTSWAFTGRDVQYMRSDDFTNWENVQGQPVQLPITPDKTDKVLVDPVKPVNGLSNITHDFGPRSFDFQDRPIIAYLKTDDDNYSQLHVARFEDGEWKIRQLTEHWSYEWNSNLHNADVPRRAIKISPVRRTNGRLEIEFDHIEEGRGIYVLDEETLEITDVLDPNPTYPDWMIGDEDDPLMLNGRELSRKSPAGTVTDQPSETVPSLRYQLWYWTLVWDTNDMDIPEGPLPSSPMQLKMMLQGNVKLIDFTVD